MQGLDQIEVDKKEERKENHTKPRLNAHMPTQFPSYLPFPSFLTLDQPSLPSLGLDRLFPYLVPQPILHASFYLNTSMSCHVTRFLSPCSFSFFLIHNRLKTGEQNRAPCPSIPSSFSALPKRPSALFIFFFRSPNSSHDPSLSLLAYSLFSLSLSPPSFHHYSSSSMGYFFWQ